MGPTSRIQVTLTLAMCWLSAGCQLLQRAEMDPAQRQAFVRVLDRVTALPSNGTGALSLEQFKPVEVPTDGIALGDLIEKGIPRGRLRSYSDEAYQQLFACVDIAQMRQCIPLTLVDRQEFYDLTVAPVSTLRLLSINELRSRMSPQDRPTPGSVVVTGLIPNPGTFQLRGDKQYRLNEVANAVSGGAEEPRRYNIIIVSRQDRTRSAINRYYFPFSASNPRVYDLDLVTVYDQFLRGFTVQDGDVLQFADIRTLPEIVAGRVRHRISEAVEEVSRLEQLHRHDAKHKDEATQADSRLRQISAPLSNLTQRISQFRPIDIPSPAIWSSQ